MDEDLKDLNNLQGSMERLQILVNCINTDMIDTNSLEGQEVDEDKVAFYMKRFKMFHEDGCPKAIDAYLHHMQNDPTINEITRIAIGSKALNL